MSTIANIAAALRRHFPVDPVPPYPPMMGMDPIGIDEYALFAKLRWTEVPAAKYSQGYDISPANGFSSFHPQYMWNYHLPGFLSASLSHHDCSADVLFSFMFSFNHSDPKRSASYNSRDPWWKSDTFSGGYNSDQCQVVIEFLELLQRSHGEPPLYHVWDASDAKTLDKWIARLQT